MTLLQIDTIPPDEIENLLSYLTPDEQRDLLALTDLQITADEHMDFSVYVDDPAGFGRELFGEYYTDDQITVAESVRDNPITIVESGNATGKSHIAARIAMWWYKTRDEAQVYTAAAPPLENLTRIMWGEIGHLTAFHEETVFAGDRLNHLHVSRDSRNFVTGVAIPSAGTPAQREAKFSGKHAKHLLFILDEGDAIPAEVYKGIESCLSGGIGRLLVMYNPRSDEGPIAAMKARGVPTITLSAFNHPNVRTGKDIVPGAVSRNKTLHRIHQWTVPATQENDQVNGYGRFIVPDFLVGCAGTNEETREPYPVLDAGERIIIEPEFAYMVLGVYPGASKGVIYDVWRDAWQQYRKQLGQEAPHLLARIESSERMSLSPDDLPGWHEEGNVSPFYDYEPNGGAVYWAIDDGYAGSLDPKTGTYTADSHPRVINFYQIKSNGDIVLFDELYMIREPKPERQIITARERPYPAPEFVVVGPGSASLGGVLGEEGYYKRTCMANVEESIKHMRGWVSADVNGHRRLKVHPRCKHNRYEMARYRRDDAGRILKVYDHGADASRYLCWVGRNGF